MGGFRNCDLVLFLLFRPSVLHYHHVLIRPHYPSLVEGIKILVGFLPVQEFLPT